MPKNGRSAPCPCGSGKKYKRCHGSIEQQEAMAHRIRQSMMSSETQRLQRERQQGLGKPIISAEGFGQRFIAVKDRLLHSQKWLTFHDFLNDYIKMAIGSKWGNSELAKPFEQRHPILVWYHYVCEHDKNYVKEFGKVHSSPMTGAYAAYLHLAYDLYALDHNADLQEKLLQRLRNHDNFHGARYEVFVAATLIRAGFEIEFENEDDRRSSHCEFTATFPRSGKRFSVEAKHCASARIRIGRQLHRALAKQANHIRIVFIDINMPDDRAGTNTSRQMDSALRVLRNLENSKINGKPLPESYLFLTNTPWHHHLNSEVIPCSVVSEGFQIPEFKGGFTAPNLRAAIDARARHTEMHELLQSILDHWDIPSTFDGEIPEFAFGESNQQLLIGQRYFVKDKNGIEQLGLLTSATVIESERKAMCGLSFDNGKAYIYMMPLSDAEMVAWAKHPDTFFGEVGQCKTKVHTQYCSVSYK